MFIGLDPGSTKSGYVVMNGAAILEHGWVENEWLIGHIQVHRGCGVVERPTLRGGKAGTTMGDTIYWAGRFREVLGHDMTTGQIIAALTSDAHGSREDVGFAIARYFGKTQMRELTGKGGILRGWTGHEIDALRVGIAFTLKGGGK